VASQAPRSVVSLVDSRRSLQLVEIRVLIEGEGAVVVLRVYDDFLAVAVAVSVVSGGLLHNSFHLLRNVL
jgi:hypothetical protein